MIRYDDHTISMKAPRTSGQGSKSRIHIRVSAQEEMSHRSSHSKDAKLNMLPLPSWLKMMLNIVGPTLLKIIIVMMVVLWKLLMVLFIIMAMVIISVKCLLTSNP